MRRKKDKIFDMDDIEFYPEKYFMHGSEIEKTDEENIISYFICLFSENLSIINVYKFLKKSDSYCRFNAYTEAFVLDVMKNYLSKSNKSYFFYLAF